LHEHADLERQLADPNLHADPGAAEGSADGSHGSHDRRDVPQAGGRRGDLAAARELGADDESFCGEVPGLEATVDELETQLSDLLAPRDPHDGDDIVLEVKSGEARRIRIVRRDLARMYIRYAERHGWTVAVPRRDVLDLGG